MEIEKMKKIEKSFERIVGLVKSSNFDLITTAVKTLEEVEGLKEDLSKRKLAFSQLHGILNTLQRITPRVAQQELDEIEVALAQLDDDVPSLIRREFNRCFIFAVLERKLTDQIRLKWVDIFELVNDLLDDLELIIRYFSPKSFQIIESE